MFKRKVSTKKLWSKRKFENLLLTIVTAKRMPPADSPAGGSFESCFFPSL